VLHSQALRTPHVLLWLSLEGEPDMLQSLMLFLAPTAAQATQPPPPAVVRPEAKRPGRRAAALRFLAQVIGNAVGFAALFGGCWLSLQLMQVFL
jgi:hypothetical protein